MEQAKKVLSVVEEAIVGVNKELIVTVTRGMFEQLNMGLFERIMALVETVVGNAEVDEVVFTGSSSRIPKLREMLSGLFR